MTKRRFLAVLGCFAIVALLAPDWGAGAAPVPTKSAKSKPTTAAAKRKTGTAKPAAAAKTPAKRDARVPLPRARPSRIAAVPVSGEPTKAAEAAPVPYVPAVASTLPESTSRAPVMRSVQPNSQAALAAAPSAVTPSADASAVKEAIRLARSGKASEATAVQRSISDPLAYKLVEWAFLRSDNNNADFSRYAAFIASNPSWPSIGFLRRRAEAMLWAERGSPAAAVAFFAKEEPLTAKGRLALARALLAQGNRAAAQAQMRMAWRNEAMSADLESQALDAFRDLLSGTDHKARMDMRLYAEDVESALRAANRAGGNAPAIAKARIAVIRKAGNAKSLLDAVPATARNDLGYIFSRAQWLRRTDKVAEAGELVMSAPRDSSQALDTDQWWIERRLLARKLLDIGDAKSAYRVTRDAAPPAKENYRIEHEFTAGWIALRFLNDPSSALVHFSRISEGVQNPISLSRAGYWQGRTAEALGRSADARRHYEDAARYTTAYYGQLARARLGLKDIVLRSPPQLTGERRAAVAQYEAVRAVELLYAIGERDLVVPIVADLGDRAADISGLAALGEVAYRNQDARSMLLVGKAALARGYALEHYAFPTIGIPDYRTIGPTVEPSVVYAIARQESIFNQRTVSSAKAMGLMQVTPAAGRYVAKRFGVSYDEKKLLSDPVYNVQLGVAELGELLDDYRGSYIMAFAGYNAGRGRVKEWIARYNDPRDPKVDPVDWVERIPFSETRNYVQRVMENLQVYRVRFGGGSTLLIEADLRRGTIAN